MAFLLFVGNLTFQTTGRFQQRLSGESRSFRRRPAMTAFKSGDPLTLNRLYGRSSGHKLRKAQQELVETLLPQIEVPAEGEITSWRLFGDDRILHFELGFCSGERLADRAATLPDQGFS